MTRALLRFGVITIAGLLFWVAPSHATLIGPTQCDGNPKIGDFHKGDWSTLKIEFDNDFQAGTYSEGPLTVRIWQENGSFGWESNLPICSVIVKGGPKANIYHYFSDYTPTTDTGLVAPHNANSGKNYGISHIDFAASPVPEPATMLLVGTGLIAVAALRKKRKK
jgi:hypothetical protein